jgi:hypothetical protein
MNKYGIFSALMLLGVLGVGRLWGQVNMSATGSYSQDFNSLITSGSGTWADNSTIANWYSQRTGTGTTINANSGTGTGGDLYSYGTGASTERALGTIGSGNAAAGHFAHGLQLRNTSGAVLTQLNVTYTLEQWRNSGAAAQSITFWYKTSTSTITSLMPNNSSGWTQVTALTLSSPVTGGTVGALDGDAAANRVTIAGISIPGLSLPNDSYIMLKWEDPDHAGADHGLAIEDVTIEWTIPTLPTLNVIPSTLNGFTYVQGAGPSASQSYSLSGINLTGAPDNITVTGSANYEISLDNTTFSGSLMVPYTSSTLPTTTIYVRLKAGLAAGTYNGETISNTGGGATTVNVNCNGSVVLPPAIVVNPVALSGFNYVQGSGPSPSQSYTLSGTNLTPAAGNLTVTGSTNYEVSLNNTTFSGSVTQSYTSGTLSATPVYVRLKAGLPAGSYNNETISNAGGGAMAQNVTCNGSVTEPPVIVVSPTSLSGFNYTQGSGPSPSQSYNLSGTNLTPAAGNLTVTGSTNYEVSLNNTTFTGSVTVSYTSGTLSATPIFVRLKAGLPAGNYNNQNISNAGGGATTQNVTCNGSVSFLAMYYRSVSTGNWNATSTWQSSTDNSSWSSATSTPSSADLAITIRAGHTVTINSTVSLDETTIEATGVLVYGTGGSLSISDGTGDDLIIFGTFQHSTGASQPYSSATIRIKNGGVLEVNNNSPTASHYGVSANVYYEGGSTFFWNLTSNALFQSDNVTYFQNSSTGEIPTFRVNTPNINVGASASTTINGIFQVDQNKVTWQNSGVKIFRNGITGSGTIEQNSNCGPFQITSTATSIAPAVMTLSTGGLTITGTAVVNLGGNELINGGTIIVNGSLFCSDKIISGTSTVFALNTGATLGIGHEQGITSSGPLGNIQTTGSRTFGSGAYYIYNGALPQATGVGLPGTIAGLTINNSNGVTASGSNTVTSIFNLSSGLLILGSFNLTIGPGCSVSGGSSASYVQTNGTGVVKRTVATSPTLFPVGNSAYNPARLTNSTGGTVFNVRVFDAVYSGGYTGTAITYGVVNRTWDVTVDGAVGNLTVQFQWNGGSEELAGFNQNLCYVSHFTNSLWDLAPPGPPSSTNPHTQTRSGITSLSPFMITSGLAFLPVELTRFYAVPTHDRVLLHWQTESEYNSDYFEPEYSVDGREFTAIGRVEAAGYSLQTRDYRFVHPNVVRGIRYYRLKQVDVDGTAFYSPVITLNLEGKKKIRVFPTLLQDKLTIQLPEERSQITHIELTDATGRLVLRTSMDAGTTEQHIEVPDLTAGTYLLRIFSGRELEVLKVLKW